MNTDHYFFARVDRNGEVSIRISGSRYAVRTSTTGDSQTVHWISTSPAYDEVPSPDPEQNKENGVMITTGRDRSVRISSDRFGVLPVFYRTVDGVHFLSNDYSAVAAVAPTSCDSIAFWEMVIFETPLRFRTLLEEIHYLEPGTTMQLAADGHMTIRRYWNFSFSESSVESDDDCADMCAVALRDAVRKRKQHPMIVPISGGVDCRLLAAAVHAECPSPRIQGITYGYNRHIWEATYAREVFEKLGWSAPHFHRLLPASYLRCKELLHKRTGALIGMQNCHLLDYLLFGEKTMFSDASVMSGMYSDAVCGWEAASPQTGMERRATFSGGSTFLRLADELCLPETVIEGVMEDIHAITDDWDSGSSLRSLDEYVYVRERNAKFHLVMADAWRMGAPVEVPFADYAVAETFFSLPASYRFKKRCTYLATAKLAPELEGLGNVSSAFRTDGLGSRWKQYEVMMAQLFNIFCLNWLGGKVQCVERCETEQHLLNISRWHRPLVEEAFARLESYGLCGRETVDRLGVGFRQRLPIFSQYQLTSNIQTLQSLTGDGI